MNEQIFLFSLAFIFTFFASIQDLKKREVANWLNFSLIVFALAFRAFYSIQTKNIGFFILGVIGFAVFFCLAYLFYYARIFAGGDAKLLMAYGIILPYEDYYSILTLSLLFIFLLFLIGAVYSLVFSLLIVSKNKQKFKKEFLNFYSKNKIFIIPSIFLTPISIIISFFNLLFIPTSLLLIIPLLLAYTKSLEKCMLIFLPPEKLTEGDWIESDIKLTKNVAIRKTVHGLSNSDIKLLQKYKRSIIIKQGIPFVPAFLFALIIMALFSLTSRFSLQNFLSFLF